jgi:uroporphyrinogen-III decarboxylase
MIVLTQTSKELVKDLFEGKSPNRVPFMPWVCSFAAKLEQVPVKTMFSDAGILSRALINSQKLFGYDAIINILDSSLEAEAIGCEVEWPDNESLPLVIGHPLSDGKYLEDLDTSDIEKKGRIPIVLEATKRLIIIKGKEVAIAGVITGPLTLARHLKGDAFLNNLNRGDYETEELIEEAGSICLRMCRTYCEIGVDMVIVAEELLGQMSPETINIAASSLRSIWNVSEFYNVNTLIISKDCDDKQIEPILDLNANGVAISGNIDYSVLKEKALERNCAYAWNIQDSALLGTDSQSAESINEYITLKDKGFFLSTEWEVPYKTNVNRMHEIMKNIRGNQGS